MLFKNFLLSVGGIKNDFDDNSIDQNNYIHLSLPELPFKR